MYKEFSITGISHSIANKCILVETNFKLNPDSVTVANVNVKVSSSGATTNYTLKVERNNIIIEFKDWPSPNIEYFLSIADIKDALDRPLRVPVNQTVIFESEVKHKVAFISPANGEAIKDNTIEVNVKATPEDEPVKGYYYEIASDVAFCDPIKTLTTSDDKVLFTDLPTGQSFIRCRVQENNDMYGEWSQPISFVIINSNDNDCDNPQNDSPFIDDLLSLNPILIDNTPIKLISVPANGNTQQSIYLVFDKEIDPNNIPDKIVAYRRDL